MSNTLRTTEQPSPPPLKDDVRSEAYIVSALAKKAHLCEADRAAIEGTTTALVSEIRKDLRRLPMVDAFMQQYGLNSAEGVLLMRLAESMIRTPDFETSSYLCRDALASGNWSKHSGQSKHPLVNAGTKGLQLTKAWITASGGKVARNLLAKLGDRVVLTAIGQAMGILGRHFVLGDTIGNAVKAAKRKNNRLATHSFDMLGEAALTSQDADRYFEDYRNALTVLAQTSSPNQAMQHAHSLSVKLSALHPRYEYLQRSDCVPQLIKRLEELCINAKSAGLSLTIDAEESERLEVSLLVFEGLLASPTLSGWEGLGLAVQAYQRRALPVIEWLHKTATRHNRRVMVRLVKGAYWDSEIKRAQELGLEHYPVFTRKEHTDISYLACARTLLDMPETIYPQFATHNAHSAATILHMAGGRKDFEFQRLHGMGDGLHNLLMQQFDIPCRTYAPVGRHKELLPYLVRRLLENGANSSFVNQLLDPEIEAEALAEDPISKASENDFESHPAIPVPRNTLNGRRLAANGMDLKRADTATKVTSLPEMSSMDATGLQKDRSSTGAQQKIHNPANNEQQIGTARLSTESDIERSIETTKTSNWQKTSSAERSRILLKAADTLEEQALSFMQLCVTEAGKTWEDALAEVREAIDFLRYYAIEARSVELSGHQPLGLVACISPWNFPLAIFLGQVSASLSVGNTVIAKPAEQTPLIAFETVKLLHTAGIPFDALHLILGSANIGAALTRNSNIDAICFTGSTATAKLIATTLAETGRAEIPFIAETGGINAMIIDSTALLEQAVQDVVDSAFQSAGQRCSACRIVCVQEDIFEPFKTMLQGAMEMLRIGHPIELHTDVGPVIDQDAKDRIEKHIRMMETTHKTIYRTPTSEEFSGNFIPPVAFELNQIKDLEEEVFGPVLHVVSFQAKKFNDVIQSINALGFGLTMGLHSRIDHRIEAVSADAKVGNLYINRNQIGAVVGVQPFGGHGLSGTGPKAGGPNYLKRLVKLQRYNGDYACPESISLPGPTGETNTLSYEPRGRLVCFGGDQPDVLALQISRTAATSNTPVTVETTSDEKIALLLAGKIDGVVADGEIRKRIAPMLAKRPGAILPLLSTWDAPERFCVEKTVSINTTAAGGNTNLLAL